MKNQSGRLLVKLTILAIMVMAIYFGFTPLNQSSAAAAAPCNCYNEDYDRMGILRSNNFCDPVC